MANDLEIWDQILPDPVVEPEPKVEEPSFSDEELAKIYSDMAARVPARAQALIAEYLDAPPMTDERREYLRSLIHPDLLPPDQPQERVSRQGQWREVPVWSDQLQREAASGYDRAEAAVEAARATAEAALQAFLRGYAEVLPRLIEVAFEQTITLYEFDVTMGLPMSTLRRIKADMRRLMLEIPPEILRPDGPVSGDNRFWMHREGRGPRSSQSNRIDDAQHYKLNEEGGSPIWVYFLNAQFPFWEPLRRALQDHGYQARTLQHRLLPTEMDTPQLEGHLGRYRAAVIEFDRALAIFTRYETVLHQAVARRLWEGA